MGTEEAAQGLDAGSIPGEGERGPWGLGLPVIWEGAISGHLCLHRSHLRGRAGPLRRRPLQERWRVPGVGGLRELLLQLPARMARWALLPGHCPAAGCSGRSGQGTHPRGCPAAPPAQGTRPAVSAGQTCEIDINECVKSPCRNGATCQNTNGSYRCLCRAGFAGRNCDTDIDDCQPSKSKGSPPALWF